MKECPFCKAEIEENARFCLYCMSSLNQKEIVTARKRKKPQWSMIIVAVVAVFLMFAIILRWNTPENTLPSGNQNLHSAPSSKPTESSVTTAPSSQPVTHPASQPTSPETQPISQPTQPTQPVSQPTQPTPQPTAPPTEPDIEEPPSDTSPPTEPPHTHNPTRKDTSATYLKSEATCLAPAVYYYSCECGVKGINTFSYGEKGDHTIVTDPEIPATCTSSGLTEKSYCKVCSLVTVAQQKISALGHTFGEVDSYAACVNCGRFPNGEPEEIILRFPEFPVEQNNKFRILSCTYTFDSGPPQQNKMEVTLTVEVMNISSVRLYEGIDVTLSEFGRGCSSTVDIGPGRSGFLTVVFTDIPAGIYDVVFQ